MLGVNNLIKNYNSIWEDYRTKLIIIGDGKIKTDLDDLIKKLKMKEAVEMKGFLKHDEVIKYIFNSKICIIPYLETPLTKVSTPTKLFEYILMDKAVVCPNFGGLSEILGSENEGLYKKGNNIDMIRVTSNLLKNSKLRKNLEKQNLKDIEKL